MNRLTCVILLTLSIAPGGGAHGIADQQSAVARTLLAQVDDLRKAGRDAEALDVADRAAEAALASGDRATECEAARLAGGALYAMGRYAESGERYTRARTAAMAAVDRPCEAQAIHGLANAAWGVGRRADARAAYEQAIGMFRELKMTRDQLRAVHGLQFVVDEKDARSTMIEEAIATAVRTGDTVAESLLRQDAGDLAFNQGNYAHAYEEFQQARQLAEAAGDDRQLAFVLTSIGRLYRAHGETDQSIEFYRGALKIQEEAADIYGQVQSLNAISSTYSRLGRLKEALEYGDRAASLAPRLQSPRVERFLSGSRASILVELGRYADALPLVTAAIDGEDDSFIRATRRRTRAVIYLRTGNPRGALTEIEADIAASREVKYIDELPGALIVRAQIRQALGDPDGALNDVKEASALLEDMRQRLVPSDYLKRGFAAWNQHIYGLTIALAERTGDTTNAFLAAEQARARAFLDLLAVRNEVRQARNAVDVAPAPRNLELPGVVASRTDLRSPLSVAAPSLERLAATAARLNSTLLSYWVGDEATFVWVMSPTGDLRVRRVRTTRAEVERLVAQTTPQGQASDTRAGRTVTARGAAVELTAAPLAALSRLHALLIEPVAPLLPKTGRLTIVPHGPLFRLSFAALRDRRGRYLLERFAIHYAPSLAVLDFTAKARPAANGFLLVSNPAPLPSVIDSVDGRQRPLPRLPGSEREARAIAALLPAGETTLLEGTRATEREVRAALHGKRVLHLATHGILRETDPLDSFIAVGSSGPEAAGDGRMTAEELYDLDLDADLVVLSACRTADGVVTGDGIFGLTRALLSAGTPSVIASSWEVADEPTSELMPAFYRAWLSSGSKVESLRQAQLLLIRNLRAGRVRAQTPLGRITLPEHPFFWAGFMLVGEPQ